MQRKEGTVGSCQTSGFRLSAVLSLKCHFWSSQNHEDQVIEMTLCGQFRGLRTQWLCISALQDLEPQQLLLFVQSFGIPVSSMSKLLQYLDQAVSHDPQTLEQNIMDKSKSFR